MRKLKQRLFSLLLCAAMLFSLCAPAAAEETETYLTWNGSELVSADVPASITGVTTGTTELNGTTTGGWYIVRSGVEISSRVTVTGDVHLILANGCTLNARQGIIVSQGNSLAIYAQSADKNTMGTLTATGPDHGAGIGGFGGAGGEITINGGVVEAIGNGGGAGIGGGDRGGGGTVIINGGTVTATSAGDGAGIGGGYGYGSEGGNITISGGTVTASSNGGGAGIGGGKGGAGGTITITGGTVKATDSEYGIYGSGTVTISGGEVTANGSNYGIYGYSTVSISGGTVKATDSKYGIYGSSTVTISGDANVTATGSMYGIYGSNDVTISGGTVKASGPSGYSGHGIYSDSSVVISGDANVTATGSTYGHLRQQ